jgi:hypothetical protein
LSESIAWELGFESLEARAASRALSDDGLEVGSGSGTTVDCTRDAALGIVLIEAPAVVVRLSWTWR